MTEPIDIAARRKLLEAASPRPWKDWGNYDVGNVSGYTVAELVDPPNAALIVAAVNDYAALLEALAEISQEAHLAIEHNKGYSATLAAIDTILRRTIR